MARDEAKPYRDDDRATIERAAELERELESAQVHRTDEVTRPGRKEIEEQLAATWARQFDAEVHRGSIQRVVPKPRWAPQPKSAEDIAADALFRKRLFVLIGLAIVIVLGAMAVQWKRSYDQRRREEQARFLF